MNDNYSVADCVFTQGHPAGFVSMIQNIMSTECRHADSKKVLDRIRQGKWRGKIEPIRNTYKRTMRQTQDAKKAKKSIAPLKRQLPGILWAGQFSERKATAIKEHSGLLVIDLDDIPHHKFTQAEEQLKSDECVWSFFVSPSGGGLKVLFRIPPDSSRHGDAWYTAVDRIKKLTGLDADMSGKDVARLCFVSYDPDLYFNPHAEELPVTRSLPRKQMPPPLNANPPADISCRHRIAEELLGSVEWTDQVTGFITCPGEELHTSISSYTDCRVHLDGAPTVHCFHQSCDQIVDNINREMRSQIGKVESSISTQPSDAEWFILPGPDSYSIIDSAKSIFTVIAPTDTLFQRGGRVVELEKRQDDVYFLSIITPSSFRSRIEQYGRTVGAYRTGKNGEPVLKKVVCPEETAKALLHSKQISHLPSITQVLNAPAIVESQGKLKILSKGCHSEIGGTLVCDGQTPPRVPITEAVQALTSLLDDFAFQSPSDKSRALAAFLSPALRIGGFVRGHVAVDMAEADKSQAGKTFRQKVVAAIYNEKPHVISQKRGGVGSLDESFSQALIQGRPFILLDNFRGKVESQIIESFVTADGMFSARVPHRGEVQVDSTRFLLQLTSNGIETTRDLANRASICRIRKQPECYRFRAYPEGDLLEHVRANHSRYLGCVFAVIEEWYGQGKPRTEEARHDFREWAQSLDWILQNIFFAAPLFDGHRDAQARTSNPSLTWLRGIALIIRDENQLGKELTASQIAEICQDHELDIPGLRNLLDEDQNKRRVGRAMAKIFNDSPSVKVDGFEVTRDSRTEYNQTHRKEITVKTYLFATSATSATREYNEQKNGPVFQKADGSSRTSRKEENHAKNVEGEVIYV